jgi:hypothetical protein
VLHDVVAQVSSVPSVVDAPVAAPPPLQVVTASSSPASDVDA